MVLSRPRVAFDAKETEEPPMRGSFVATGFVMSCEVEKSLTAFQIIMRDLPFDSLWSLGAVFQYGSFAAVN